jgi:hypothetical protein
MNSGIFSVSQPKEEQGGGAFSGGDDFPLLPPEVETIPEERDIPLHKKYNLQFSAPQPKEEQGVGAFCGDEDFPLLPPEVETMPEERDILCIKHKTRHFSAPQTNGL